MSDDRLLTVKETARYLSTTPGRIYDWIKTGSGPRHVRIGRSVRYRQSDLEAFIEARIVEPTR